MQTWEPPATLGGSPWLSVLSLPWLLLHLSFLRATWGSQVQNSDLPYHITMPLKYHLALVQLLKHTRRQEEETSIQITICDREWCLVICLFFQIVVTMLGTQRVKNLPLPCFLICLSMPVISLLTECAHLIDWKLMFDFKAFVKLIEE